MTFRAFYTSAILLIAFSLSAQNAKVDSLQTALKAATSDIERIQLNLLISEKIYSSNPLLSLECSNAAIRLASGIKHDSLLYRSYLNQANTYMHLGNYPRALQLYQDAINGAHRIKNSYLLSMGYGNMGSIYYYRRDHDNALKNYLEALEHFNAAVTKPEKNRAGRKANLLNNIGIIYEEKKEFAKAAGYYDDAYAMGKEMNDTELMGNVLNNKGTMYLDQNDEVQGYAFYKQAMDLRKATNNKLGLARSYNNIGKFFYEKKHDLPQAEAYFKNAISLGKEISAWQTVSSSSEMLHHLYLEKNDYRNAYETLQLNMQVNDSLFNEANTRKIAQLEMQFEFDKKQNQQEADQKEKDLYVLMVTGGLLAMLTIVTLLFFLQRNKTRRSQLEQVHLELEKANLKNDLEQKDKELATNIMYLLNKNELINTISEKLLAIKQTTSPEAQGAVQKVILDLQSNLQPELWQEFEFRFQQVHEHFYKTLNERFPDLSPAEIRLCAFLKLNMTTKEISAITHQNAKSIDVARTRLRKKLNLTGTDHNLVTFLASLEKAPSQH